MSHDAEFESAVCEAARAAGEILARRFVDSEPVAVERKGLHDFVTEVDREAEQVVLDYVRTRYPDHSVMAEEGSPDAKSEGYRWIVDPLDGTTNFIHGVPLFAVSIALEDPDGLVAGAIHDPIRDETFHGHRGGGARLNGEPIRCSQPAGPHEALSPPASPSASSRGSTNTCGRSRASSAPPRDCDAPARRRSIWPTVARAITASNDLVPLISDQWTRSRRRRKSPYAD